MQNTSPDSISFVMVQNCKMEIGNEREKQHFEYVFTGPPSHTLLFSPGAAHSAPQEGSLRLGKWHSLPERPRVLEAEGLTSHQHLTTC